MNLHLYIRSSLSNLKQKRFNPIQLPQSTHPVILAEPSSANYQLWQQNHPASFNTMSVPTDLNKINDKNTTNDYLLANSEHDPRSLLGKYVSISMLSIISYKFISYLRTLKTDLNDASTQINSNQDHGLFLQTLLLSLLNISIDQK